MLRNLLRPMTHLEIWTMKSEDIKVAIQQETEELHKQFLSLLLAYAERLGAANQTYYPPEALSTFIGEINRFIPTIPTENHELIAAAENLKALTLQKFEKNYEQAQAIYHRELSMAGHLSGSAQLCLWTNCILSYLEQKQVMQANRFAEYVLKQLPHLTDNNIPRETRAAVYITLAISKAKLHDPIAASLYQAALELWPENNVVGNNAAIMLSKINDKKSLELAEAILNKLYPKAKENLLFVTLYYLGDVTIKLASFESGEERNERLSKAQQYMALARLALHSKNEAGSAKYIESYVAKGEARLAYLQANIESVRGNEETFLAAKNLAIDLRKKVAGEKVEKLVKFTEKMKNCGQLFRYPDHKASEIKLEPVVPVSQLKLT